MKVRRVLGTALVVGAGLSCWLSISPPAPGIRAGLALNTVWGRRYFNGPDTVARLKVENEVTDIPEMGGSARAAVSEYDPYFIHVNDFRQILIPANKSKTEKDEVILPQ